MQLRLKAQLEESFHNQSPPREISFTNLCVKNELPYMLTALQKRNLHISFTERTSLVSFINQYEVLQYHVVPALRVAYDKLERYEQLAVIQFEDIPKEHLDIIMIIDRKLSFMNHVESSIKNVLADHLYLNILSIVSMINMSTLPFYVKCEMDREEYDAGTLAYMKRLMRELVEIEDTRNNTSPHAPVVVEFDAFIQMLISMHKTMIGLYKDARFDLRSDQSMQDPIKFDRTLRANINYYKTVIFPELDMLMSEFTVMHDAFVSTLAADTRESLLMKKINSKSQILFNAAEKLKAKE